MERFKSIPWPRIFAEGIAIVASILLAFWIQAWWEARQNRLAERAILSSILQEFRDIKATLVWRTTYNEAIRASIRRLTDSAIGTGPALSDEDIDGLLADLWWNQETSEWAALELSSVISSGDLALISDADLRHLLGIWPIRLEYVRNVLQRDISFHMDRQMLLLAELTALGQLHNADDGPPGFPELPYDGGRKIALATSVSHADLLSNRKFQNMLLERDTLITDILTLAFPQVADDLDETIRLLEAEPSLADEK